MMNCTIRVAKTKELISFAVTAKLICVFVFAYADCWFSHEANHMLPGSQQQKQCITHTCCEIVHGMRSPEALFPLDRLFIMKDLDIAPSRHTYKIK